MADKVLPQDDVATKLEKKSLKRRNFKKLQLSPGGAGPSSAPQDQTSTNPVVTQQHPKQRKERSYVEKPREEPAAELSSQLASLDLDLHFKLDLRSEDLEMIADLGHGNGGMVTKVLHKPTQTVMAKKVIHIEAKPAVRKQIVRELHIMQDCNSNNIVSYYGAFANESDVIMCMEYMDCGSLDRISKKFGAIAEDVIGKITVAVVEGLTYLYNEHRIIHRDVKPSNVLVNSKGEIKLCDFGVSGELINSIADTFVGTSTYMSPERIQGAKYTAKSDVWSLGITLLELALGRFPFNNNNMDSIPVGILDLLQRIVNEPPPTLPEDTSEKQYSQDFRNFIAKCLLKEQERPSPQNLLTDPFFLRSKQTNVPLESWAQQFKIDSS